MNNFPQIKPGQTVKVNWKKQVLRAACCNCALVHNVRFKVSGDVLTLRAWENKKLTKMLRQKMDSGFLK